jgi:7-carboxy-7-deazaguanine synthase
MSKTAPLQEIFSSIQGEGIHVGCRQVFVRFAHCHLKCAYCDTPMTSADGLCHLETPPGSGQLTPLPNPMTPQALADAILSLWPLAPRHHSVSYTGGEPLLYHGFLAELLPLLRLPAYIETSGTQPEFLEPLLPWVTTVAMDIKLPSATQEPARYADHAAFYQLARQRELFVKVVFNEHTTPEELDAIRAIVTDPSTPLILQPETSLTDRLVHVPPAKMLWVESELSTHFQHVRVIPQTHKLLNVL